MDFALRELWGTGFLHVLFYPSSFLCYVGWAAVLLGGLIQWFLLKRTKHIWTKWALPGLLLAGLLAGEIGCQVITGWDRLLPMLGYWLCLLLLLGCGIAWGFHYFLKKRAS